MPFTIADVDKHKLGLDAKQKRQWVAIANSVLSKCIADGGTDETCAPRAIIQANGAVGSKAMTDEQKAEGESLDVRIERVREAFRQSMQRQVPEQKPEGFDFWVREVFDDHVIIHDGPDFWRATFTTDDDDNMTFAPRDEWTEVEQAFVEKMLGETLIAYGGAIKATAGGKVEGYLVTFTDEENLDLEGEFFDGATDYDLISGERSTVYYHHGQDQTLKKMAIGDGTLTPDSVGVWLDAQLDMRDRYIAALHRKLEEDDKAGKSHFGLSSGTAPHLVEREKRGNGVWIKRWPLRLDASITPTPAEPTTRVITLKAYTEQADPEFSIKALLPEDTSKEDVSADAVKEPAKPQKARAPVRAPVRNSSGDYRPKSKATGGGKVTLKRIPINGQQYVFDVAEDGTRGDPRGLFDDAEKAEAYIAAELQPPWLKAMVKMTADNAALMQAQQKATDERYEKMFAAMAAQTTPGGKGYSFSGEPTKPQKGFLDFLRAVIRKDVVTLKAMGSEWTEYEGEYSDGTKVLGDQTGGEGGFLVPTQFLTDLISVEPEREIVWPRADIIPMTNRAVQVPGLSTAGSTPGETNMIPGMVGSWIETGTDKVEQELLFTQIELVAHEYSGWIAIKEALMQDSPISVESIVRKTMRDAVRFYRDEAFLDGTGTGQPQGVIDAPGTFAQARRAGGAIDYLDLVNMKQHLLPSSWTDAMWVFHQSCYTSLRTMQDPEGHYIWVDNARDGEPARILGFPYMFTEKTQTLGLRGDVILADWQWYYVGNKQELSIAKSEHVLFLRNQIVIKFVMRVDGQEKLPLPIFLKDGITEVSPFIVLDAGGTT